MADVLPNPHRQHNETMLRELKKGNLIEFPRGAYSHWAVYIGRDEVVHVVVNANDVSSAWVRRDNFWSVVKGSRAVKNIGKDEIWPHFGKDVTVNRALSKLGRINYDVLNRNCEHFVNWCRYGKEESDQVDSIWTRFAARIVKFFGIRVSSSSTTRTT